MPDPDGLLRGTGKAMRHVQVRGIKDVGGPGLRALMLAAREERRVALGLPG